MADAPPRPPAPTTPPHFKVPSGACDTHFHLYEESPKYKPAPGKAGSRPVESRYDYLAMIKTLGVERGVFVNSGYYGNDNTLVVDVVRELKNLRGIARMDASTSEADLKEMADAGGIRGIRVSTRSADAKILGDIEALVRRIEPLGWHLQLHLSPAILCDLAPRLRQLSITMVIDHMARFPAGTSTDSKEFRALAGLLETGRVWVKLSAPNRNTTSEPPYEDVVPLARALVALAPERMVWGTDWPNVNYPGTMPDAGMLLDCLATWAPDEAVRNRILVDNPAKLYGF